MLRLQKEIIHIVKQLNLSNDKAEIAELEIQLEVKVAKAFGVEPITKLD